MSGCNALLFFLKINTSDSDVWWQNKRWISWVITLKITKKEFFLERVLFTSNVLTVIRRFSAIADVPMAVKAYNIQITISQPTETRLTSHIVNCTLVLCRVTEDSDNRDTLHYVTKLTYLWHNFLQVRILNLKLLSQFKWKEKGFKIPASWNSNPTFAVPTVG
jgi:hypothetical protein